MKEQKAFPLKMSSLMYIQKSSTPGQRKFSLIQASLTSYNCFVLWKEHRVQTIVYSCFSSQGTEFASSIRLKLLVHPAALCITIQHELRNQCVLLEQALTALADEDLILYRVGTGVLKQSPLHPWSAASSLFSSWRSIVILIRYRSQVHDSSWNSLTRCR